MEPFVAVSEVIEAIAVESACLAGCDAVWSGRNMWTLGYI